jgi:hypothetical protein
MKTFKKVFISIGLIICWLFLFGGGCSASNYNDTAAGQENATRKSNYDRLVENQPAHTMTYSPTRETKNFWIDTWGEPGKLSYVYMMNGSGDIVGYYIFEGLPVSYGVSLIPPYELIWADLGQYDGQIVVPAPSIDGTYASAANVHTFYGKDALTGAYMEYYAGFGLNPLLHSEPVPLQKYAESQPMGAATFDDVPEIEDHLEKTTEEARKKALTEEESEGITKEVPEE